MEPIEVDSTRDNANPVGFYLEVTEYCFFFGMRGRNNKVTIPGNLFFNCESFGRFNLTDICSVLYNSQSMEHRYVGHTPCFLDCMTHRPGNIVMTKYHIIF